MICTTARKGCLHNSFEKAPVIAGAFFCGNAWAGLVRPILDHVWGLTALAVIISAYSGNIAALSALSGNRYSTMSE